LTHPQGYAIMQALIARNIVGDFRAPNNLRFGFTPLYLRYVDLWDCVEALVDIMSTESWNQPQFLKQQAVT
jgi:kynureninase